ncbi:hypothetical protein C8R44DRAFT_734192 [Mycena epipterygia]|nr:hypothetical protein C8R44DRAFT_734192 [Mycena epipterygia]
MHLKGHGGWEKVLQVLEEEDVCALNKRAMTAEEAAKQKQLVELGWFVEEEGLAPMQTLVVGETHCTLSWIWYNMNAADPKNKQELFEVLCVEWCKAYSRTRCWTEDVVLVEEEMRHTIKFGFWSASEWKGCAMVQTGVSDELQEGLGTYPAEQMQQERSMCLELQKKWAYLVCDALLTGEDVVILLDKEEMNKEEEDELAQEEIGPDKYEDDDGEDV